MERERRKEKRKEGGQYLFFLPVRISMRIKLINLLKNKKREWLNAR